MTRGSQGILATMPPQGVSISVVLLSYDRPQYLRRVLETVVAEPGLDFEVIVVDNRSPTSDRIAEIVAAFPTVRLIRNPDNGGFTGGMNVGIAAARGEYVYLTEDDIEIEPGCLSALVAYLESRPDVGLAGPVMLNHGDDTVRCAGGHVELGPIYRLTVLAAGEPSAASRLAAPYEVTYLPGSMLMARRALLRELGGFRDDFFMYIEDVDLCIRVLKRRLAIAVVPEARVRHYDPAPVGAPGLDFHKTKNLSAVYLLHAPLRVLPAFLLRYGLLGGARAIRAGGAGAHVRAWTWALVNAPRLLAERFRAHPGVRPSAPASP